MLPKKARLTAKEVREVITQGRSYRSGSVSAKYLPGPLSQAAVVVRSKIAKSAVARNRLRRAAYQALEGKLPPGRVVFFLNTPVFDPTELTILCSKLSS